MGSNPQTPSPLHDLAGRPPVWDALSEIWLDIDLSPSDLDYLAACLHESPYSLQALKDIHRLEVATVLFPNLLSVAGEWTGFDGLWLAERCGRRASRRRSALARLYLEAVGRLAETLVKDELEALFGRVEGLRRQLPRPQEGS